MGECRSIWGLVCSSIWSAQWTLRGRDEGTPGGDIGLPGDVAEEPLSEERRGGATGCDRVVHPVSICTWNISLMSALMNRTR